jgi:predicted enzyme related to lactoylglutathione lyase
MERVTGIGGIFFKGQDPQKLSEWYNKHLGVPVSEHGTVFEWRHKDNPEKVGATVWSVFNSDTDYFAPSTAPFMINYRVADLRGLLEVLKSEGVEVGDKIDEYDYGLFAWITDPEGNRIELWQPAEGF